MEYLYFFLYSYSLYRDFEQLTGRPAERADKQPLRMLYHRYKRLKAVLSSPEGQGEEEEEEASRESQLGTMSEIPASTSNTVQTRIPDDSQNLPSPLGAATSSATTGVQRLQYPSFNMAMSLPLASDAHSGINDAVSGVSTLRLLAPKEREPRGVSDLHWIERKREPTCLIERFLN